MSLGFLRWHLLVNALGISFSLRDAFRLGFIGYLFNFLSLGSVGGDVFKAMFVAHEQPGRRLEAIATIAVDRVLGLLGLLLVASFCLTLVRIPGAPSQIDSLARMVVLLTVVGFLTLVMLLVTSKFQRWVMKITRKVPRIGPRLHTLLANLLLYQQRKRAIFSAIALSVMVHVTIAVTIHLCASGIYSVTPTLAQHFVISPLANVVGALPIAPSGMGTFEVAMRYLYDQVPAGKTNQDMGLVVGIVFRAITVVTAVIGLMFYLVNRRRISSVSSSKAEAEAARPALTTNG